MENRFHNPIMPCADPFLLLYEGKYYLYSTTESDPESTGYGMRANAGAQEGFYVYVSDDLHTWENKGYCLKSEDVMGNKWFWAPEVLYHKEKFYMVYSSEEHIGVAVADNPLGPFTQAEKKWLYSEKAIDGHWFLDDDGTVYLYYVRLDGGNRIFVAKMSSDLLSIDTQYENCLIEAEQPWETVDCLVAEGPFVLKHKDWYYLTYSCNHTRCQDYAVGVAVSQSPTGPFEKYSGNPILHKNNQFCGVGHHSFAMSKDNATLICAYHCHDSLENFVPRRFCLNTAQFVDGADGIDVLVINGPE